jgi:hypothetical protein
MVKGRDVLKGDGDRAKERCEVRRSLVVEEKMGRRVRKRAKKGDNRLEGRYVGRGSAGHHGVQVDVLSELLAPSNCYQVQVHVR